MSFVKTWTFSLNNLASDRSTILQEQRCYMKAFTDFLIANGWTADGSSNSSATHVTTNITTLAHWVWATAGSPHTWLVLKSPVGIFAGLDGTYLGDQSRLWVVIDCNYASAVSFSMILYPANKPATNPTTSAAPTGTNGMSCGSSAAYTQFARATLSTPALFHFAITSGGHFWTGTTYMATGIMPSFHALLPGINPVQYLSKDYPYAIGVLRIYSDGVGNPAGDVPSASLWGINVDGTSLSGNIAIATLKAIANTIGTGQTYGLNRAGVNETSPGILYNFSAAGGTIAEVPDFEFTGGTVPNRMVDNSATPTKCLFGGIWLPVNALIQA